MKPNRFQIDKTLHQNNQIGHQKPQTHCKTTIKHTKKYTQNITKNPNSIFTTFQALQ